MTTDTASERYETLFARLQVIVTRLESGDLALEESLLLYEEGTAIALACQRLLDSAALSVQQIQQGHQQSE
jgi:exodeoxyribonuclease VII small subunit